MNINVDMKLIHKSTIALSYIVWYRLENLIFILRVGCDMNFRENAISLADKLRSPEDQVNYLQKNRIFITSFNCLVCDIVWTGKVAETTSTSDALIIFLKGALGRVFCSGRIFF